MPEYTNAIVNFLNSQFLSDDIHSIAIGDTIMCIDIKLPKGIGKVEKKASVEERVNEKLSLFKRKKISQFDKTILIEKAKNNVSSEDEVKTYEFRVPTLNNSKN